LEVRELPDSYTPSLAPSVMLILKIIAHVPPSRFSVDAQSWSPLDLEPFELTILTPAFDQFSTPQIPS
jgi:hypothetical protein